jgi:antitoxin HigA-1
MKKLEPIHPGEILQEDFLLPMDISQSKLAEDTGISLAEVEKIIAGKTPITPNAALRLSLYFGLSERFWLNLQSRHDLEAEKDKLADRLQKEVRVLQAA